LVSYILEAIQENILTSTSRAKEVNARIDILKAVQFITDSWRKVSTKTIQNCFSHCDFEDSDLEMPNKADSEGDVILEMYHVRNFKNFNASTVVCNVIMRMKVVRKQLLNKFQRNNRRHQKIRKPMRMARPSVND
jgi:hypothetical protein